MDQSEIIKSAQEHFSNEGLTVIAACQRKYGEQIRNHAVTFNPEIKTLSIWVSELGKTEWWCLEVIRTEDNPQLSLLVELILASTHEVPVGEWTSELPTKPGWYWVKTIDCGEWTDPYVVHLREYAGEICIGNLYISSGLIPRLWWSIPIPIPNTDGAVGLQEQEK